MSDGPGRAGEHPTDGHLVRLLDGEADDPALQEHLEGCRECSRRYRRLREWSYGVSRALAAADPVVREELDAEGASDGGDADSGAGGPSSGRAGSGGSRRLAKVAAAVLLLLAGALALSPVRAWVVDRVEGVARRLGLAEPAGPAVDGTGGGTEGASVSFAPDGTELVIRLESRQQSGELEVTGTATGSDVTASVVGGRDLPIPSLAVHPSELRIRNRPDAGASYRVEVPASLERVVVRVGGRSVARLSGAQLRAGVSWSWALEDVPEGGRGRGGTPPRTGRDPP